MSTTRALPRLDALNRIVVGALPGGCVVARERNELAAGSGSEIVTCAWPDGTRRQLLVKYDRSAAHSDVAYEALVYRRVLEPSLLTTVRLYGAAIDDSAGRTCLLLEWLDGAVTAGDVSDTASLCTVARWIGRFHREADARLEREPLDFLKRYDADFYADCARRARDLAADAAARRALERIYERFASDVAPLLRGRETIAHWDLHLDNVLLRDGDVFPIDWELAGLDVGEIDLAALTDGWGEGAERRCADAYRRERWPEGAPPDADRVLLAARLCLSLYALSRPEWITDGEAGHYTRNVVRAAGGLGLSR